MKRSDAVDLIRWLSREAHKRGLGMGLKNVKGEAPGRCQAAACRQST
jgi:hypothetical protein